MLMKSQNEQAWTFTLRKPFEFFIDWKVIYSVIFDYYYLTFIESEHIS